MAGLVLDSDVPGCWDDLFFDDCWVARKLMPFCALGYKGFGPFFYFYRCLLSSGLASDF